MVTMALAFRNKTERFGVTSSDEGEKQVDRVFLGLVGGAYVGLALWCALAPESTSRSVGFELRPGSGQSEFLTVYGGLEWGLGLVFLDPVIRRRPTGFALQTCLVIHVSLVAFRSLAFLLYRDLPTTTLTLAATEWIIALASGACWWSSRSRLAKSTEPSGR